MLAQLRAIRGALDGRVILLVAGQKISLGRGSRNTIHLDDADLSRRHSLFENDGVAWIVSDLNSRNGTWVNGQRVTSRALQDGDRVGAGGCEFEFRRSSAWQSCIDAGAHGPTPGTVVLEPASCPQCGAVVHVPEGWAQAPARPVEELVACCTACAARRSTESFEGFQILAQVSEDRLAPVYEAARPGDPRRLALKVLRKSPLVSEDTAQRFQREMAWQGLVRHPGIAEIFTGGETAVAWYLVMEFVPGTTADDLLIRGGALPPAVALYVAIATAHALHHLHEQGIVHRDVKPSNLMVTPDGAVKLIDMGSARRVHAGDDAGITRTGVGYGSLQFMPPEQAFDAKRVDRRADVYALGATLFTLLTGKYAFKVYTMADVLAHAQVGEWLPPHHWNPDVPPAVDAAVRRMMQSDPHDRPQGMATVIRELSGLAPADPATVGALVRARLGMPE